MNRYEFEGYYARRRRKNAEMLKLIGRVIGNVALFAGFIASLFVIAAAFQGFFGG